jgi:Abnormal spindle-like microcephaly-assoc'd, ASPM-SPD-2-Hydin
VTRRHPTQLLCAIAALTGLLANPMAVARAQSAQFVFAYVFAPNNNAIPLPNGGQITFPNTAVGATAPVTFVIANTGTGAASVGSVSLTGTAFTPTNLPVLPATLAAGQQLQFTISYSPQQVGTDSGTVVVAAGGTSYTFGLSGSGITSAQLVFAYIFAPNNNAVSLPNGGQITFPVTPVGTASPVTFVIANTGSSAVPISSVSVTGSAFAPVGLPLVPASLAAGQQFQFTISYSPQQAGTDTGKVAVAAGASSYTFALNGSGITSAFSYTIVGSNGSTMVAPGGTIQFPNTTVLATSTIPILITNVSSSAAAIASATAVGTGFQVGSGQSFPVTVPVGGAITIAIQFTPQTPAGLNGILKIGNDSFVLQGTGLGPQLTFAYSSGSGTIALNAGDSIIFPPVQLGSTASATLSVTNTGTAAATITSVGIAGAKSPFAISGTPKLPVSLAPGSNATIGLTFSPQTTGNSADALQVDKTSFPLAGVGTAPPPLPSYQITGPGDTVTALQQPQIGLVLSAPYPLAISGTLTLTQSPAAFAADPAVQFATGGQTVAFSIPAGQTNALFNGTSTSDQIQTGTVAGQIVLTPAFSTVGGFNLTPASPPTLVTTIANAAPVLLSAQVTTLGTGTISLQVIGYATSRSVTTLNLQIQPAPGVSIASPNIQIDSTANFGVWYNSAQSTAFGSLFQATIPLTLGNGTSSSANPAATITSIAVSASNGIGKSNVVTAPLQ